MTELQDIPVLKSFILLSHPRGPSRVFQRFRLEEQMHVIIDNGIVSYTIEYIMNLDGVAETLKSLHYI